jgi:Fuc2NAc and GlcNAc transferase
MQWWVAGLAFLLALGATWWVRRLALAHDMLDRPNERSSHVVPTPRGGGIAIVAASLLAIVALFACSVVDARLTLALAVGGVAIALVGFVDDRRSLPASRRALVHLIAAIYAVAVLGGFPPLQIGDRVIDLGLAGDALAVVAVVWTINLFNFMDGIDGIAGSEGVFIALAGSALCAVAGASPGAAAAALAVGAASLGFLVWNWPPARIFMGDVGSGYVGFVIAVLALAAAREIPAAIFQWWILGGVFFVDATVTLLRRVVRGDNFHIAHRTHAYQWLARRWRSHGTVTVAVLLLDVVWLLPFAALAARRPQIAVWVTAVALLPLALLALYAGAGRSEKSQS